MVLEKQIQLANRWWQRKLNRPSSRQKLNAEKLVLDWRKKQQTRQSVRLCIEEELDKLPEVYERPIYERKCDLTYRHVYDSYFGERRSIYDRAA